MKKILILTIAVSSFFVFSGFTRPYITVQEYNSGKVDSSIIKVAQSHLNICAEQEDIEKISVVIIDTNSDEVCYSEVRK